jgi:hypothetical protein
LEVPGTKTRDTIDAIGFVAAAGVLTAGVAVLGVVQAAAAGVDLLVVTPFAGRARAKTTIPATAPQTRIERRLPQAA